MSIGGDNWGSGKAAAFGSRSEAALEAEESATTGYGKGYIMEPAVDPSPIAFGLGSG
jgi:hypothetical protein